MQTGWLSQSEHRESIQSLRNNLAMCHRSKRAETKNVQGQYAVKMLSNFKII